MNRRLLTAGFIALVALAICFSVRAFGQVPTSSIVGTVVDAQNAAVQDAEVTATSKDTGTKYTTHTASNGGYIFSSLNLGTYKIDASKTGFKVGSIDNVKLDASTQ